MAIMAGDRVTYAKTRATQYVPPERRNATGVVAEVDIIGGELCARVLWDWCPDAGFWTPGWWLEMAPERAVTPPE